ncbi:MAG: hypothetical protein ACI3ZD_10225 [Prevotella sp.]|jgi:hypothetical protein|nr:MAG TPA: hypothetical protein [Bacteriophage sp.]
MEENVIVEESVDTLEPELLASIEKKAKELKEKNPDKKIIFPIVVDGNVEFGEKEHYVGYFCQPSFKTFSKYLTAAQNNQAVAMRVLAKDCFVDGDRDLVDDDSLFLFGLMGQLSKIIEMRHGRLVNLSKPGK